MVCVTLEELWMLSEKIVNFRFLVKFHRSGLSIILRFWIMREHYHLCHEKAPNQAKHLINMVCVNLEWLWMVSDRINDFRFFVKFHKSGPAIIFCFWSTMEHVSYASKKLLKNKNTSSTCFVLVTLEGLWIISDRIVDFRFFVKFQRSAAAILFSFSTFTEHVLYASKKILIKQKTASTWCVLLWNDYGWFLIQI